MQSTNRKVFDKLVSRTKIYLVIILILLIAISVQNSRMIIPSVIVYILVLWYAYFANNKRKNEISEKLQDLMLSVDTAAKSTLINSPFPLIVLETDGNIIWRSSKFVSEFEKIDMNPYLDDLIIEIKKDIKNKKEEQQYGVKHAKTSQLVERQVVIGEKTYRISGKYVKSLKISSLFTCFKTLSNILESAISTSKIKKFLFSDKLVKLSLVAVKVPLFAYISLLVNKVVPKLTNNIAKTASDIYFI